MKFDNSYINLPPHFYAHTRPAVFTHPELIGINEKLAEDLGLDLKKYSRAELAKIFTGQIPLEGSHTISLAYAGHQFGHFVPSLGDGRAMLLGEVIDHNGKRYDLQLKGAGPTNFSRRGDGMSALGPVIREYIVSEAMHHLNIPTTRALAAVATGEKVQREEMIAGGVFTRVASSHIRIGTFQYFAAQGDIEGVKQLLHYSINRHYPQIQNDTNPAISFLNCVMEAQSNLVAKWMSVGFIHGVMNTDNMSISGETIDYGPCAFMDTFNFNQVYSFIDKNGRYRYGNQPQILVWNLSRLADCLIPLVHDNEAKAIEMLNEVLQKVLPLFKTKFQDLILQKFGIEDCPSDKSEQLISLWLEYLQTEKLDFTLSFRNLTSLIDEKSSTLEAQFPKTELLMSFLSEWRILAPNAKRMNEINPLFIPRNHQVERAIQSSLKGDYSVFHEMNKVFEMPFSEQISFQQYTLPPEESEQIKNTFCGT